MFRNEKFVLFCFHYFIRLLFHRLKFKNILMMNFLFFYVFIFSVFFFFFSMLSGCAWIGFSFFIFFFVLVVIIRFEEWFSFCIDLFNSHIRTQAHTRTHVILIIIYLLASAKSHFCVVLFLFCSPLFFIPKEETNGILSQIVNVLFGCWMNDLICIFSNGTLHAACVCVLFVWISMHSYFPCF